MLKLGCGQIPQLDAGWVLYGNCKPWFATCLAALGTIGLPQPKPAARALAGGEAWGPEEKAVPQPRSGTMWNLYLVALCCTHSSSPLPLPTIEGNFWCFCCCFIQGISDALNLPAASRWPVREARFLLESLHLQRERLTQVQIPVLGPSAYAIAQKILCPLDYLLLTGSWHPPHRWFL